MLDKTDEESDLMVEINLLLRERDGERRPSEVPRPFQRTYRVQGPFQEFFFMILTRTLQCPRTLRKDPSMFQEPSMTPFKDPLIRKKPSTDYLENKDS